MPSRRSRRSPGDYGVKWPKAVAKITDDREALLCFFDFPALRHEAPHDRVGVRDHHGWAVAAA